MERLLERQAVLAELGAQSRHVARSGGRVVLLRGEAGVGKTAVIARFVSELNGSMRPLQGWCDPLGTPRPLGPLIDALVGLDTAAAAALSAAMDAADITALYERLLGVLRAGQPWVWVIEDAHWADGATLDMLRFLARRIGAVPLLLLVSYRDDEVGPQHPLTLALGDVASCAAVSRIGLNPLSREAVAILAAGSGVNADQLYELTSGNPFCVTEVLAASPDVLSRGGLPRSVSEAAWGRLARLSARARDVAYAVAVCGPRADPDLLEKTCPGAGRAMDECLGAGVLVAGGQVVGFRHELARRATLDQIPGYQRQLLHKRALAALAEPPVDPDLLAALVLHASEAGDSDAVIAYGPAAAGRAAVLGAHREAAQLYALVLRHADTTPAEQKVVWLEAHAFENYLSGQAHVAVESWRDAIALRHELGDQLEEADDLRWLSHLLVSEGSNAEATNAGMASLRLLQDRGPTPQLAWSLVNMAQLSTFAYDPAAAEYADRAVSLGVKLDDDAVVFMARSHAALDRVFRADTGWDELETIWRDATSNESLAEHVGYMAALICWTAATHHDMGRAEGYLAETAVFCHDHELGIFLALATGAEALARLYRGEWDRAALAADQILTRPELSPLHRLLPLVTVALIRARRGEKDVPPLLDEATGYARPDHVGRLGLVCAARAEAAWLAGDDDTARAEAHAGLATTTQHTDPWLVGHLRRWAHLSASPTESTKSVALTPYELEIRGEWEAASDAWIGRGCPYDAAIAQLGGDIGAVESALTTFRSLGARAATRRAQQRLVALRGPTSRSRRAETLADPDRLTRREREVLELLATGRSDIDIAATLHISPKTVGCHVSSILAKLHVDNRIQAAARTRQPRRTISPRE